MDNNQRRQRRIAKITQALIDENVLDEQENTQDDDFELIKEQAEEKSSSESSGKSDDQPVNMKELEKEKRKRKNQSKIELCSARDALKSRITKTQIKEQFRLSDADFTNHVAVTVVWNTMAREKAATQLALDNIQYQQNYEILQQQLKFTDYKPYQSQIQSANSQKAFQYILELHFGQQAKFIQSHLQQKTSIEVFQTLQEAKQLPDGFDYQKLLDAYQKSIIGKNFCRQIVKVQFIDGKLSKFEQGSLFDKNNNQNTNNQNNNNQNINNNQNQSQNQNKNILFPIQQKTNQNQALQAAQKYQQDMYLKSRALLQTQQTTAFAQKAVSKLYNVKKAPRNPVNQENYRVLPNSVQTQTDVTFKQEYGVKTEFYTTVLDPPKRTFFSKFYNLKNGVPDYFLINVQLQTDVTAKMLKGSVISDQNLGGDGANAIVYIDEEQYELNKTDHSIFSKLLPKAKTVQVLRSKGRVGRMMNDFLQLLKQLRPDISQQGEDLYVNQRNRGEPQKDKILCSTEREGTWSTLEGLIYEEPGVYEVAQVMQDEFFVDKNIIQYNVSNNHDQPCFIDKFYNLLEEGTTYEQVLKERELSEYKNKFKYIHPVTEEGYNTLEQYKQIQSRLKKEESKHIQLIEKDLNQIKTEIKQCMQIQEFSRAHELYMRGFELLTPSYVKYTGLELGEDYNQKPKQNEFNVAYKILNSHKYRPID